MPRLVPRLVKALTSPNGHFLTRSGGETVVSTPPISVKPSLATILHTRRKNKLDPSAKRTKSILLDEVNPITTPDAYQIRKMRGTSLALEEDLDPELKQLLHDEMLKQRANPYRAYCRL